MPVRLVEVHPALVHFPLALLPVAIGSDLAGRVTGRRDLYTVGRLCIAGAAASAALAGLFGFIAQEEVNAEGEAREVLQTHRTLNVLALGAMTALAISRAAMRRPSPGYLLAGIVTMAGVAYSAYLGGRLVYALGVGVEKADGLYGEPPELTTEDAGRAVSTAARDLGRGVLHTLREIAQGEIAPALGRRSNGQRHG